MEPDGHIRYEEAEGAPGAWAGAVQEPRWVCCGGGSEGDGCGAPGCAAASLVCKAAAAQTRAAAPARWLAGSRAAGGERQGWSGSGSRRHLRGA